MTTDASKIHVFERAGFGKAPYRLSGYTHEIYQSNAGGLFPGPIQPGATCDFCAAAICDVFHIISADGVRFKVGSTCVMKTGDAGIVDEVKREVNRLNRERKYARNIERIERAKETFERIRDSLAKLPHPNDWHAERGATRADWCDWMFQHAGMRGRIEACRVIERAWKERLDTRATREEHGPSCPCCE